MPEETADFDREYRRVMAEATQSLDLSGVVAMLIRWQRVAWSSRDPVAHRRMLDLADRLGRGEPIETESWWSIKTRLGL